MTENTRRVLAGIRRPFVPPRRGVHPVVVVEVVEMAGRVGLTNAEVEEVLEDLVRTAQADRLDRSDYTLRPSGIDATCEAAATRASG